MFPKIIHQIWYQGADQIPFESKKNIDKIQQYHKNWQYQLWDNNKIINLIKDDASLLQAYLGQKYMHQKIDFAKYIILNIFGGAYIDMDVEIIKSLDSLLDEYHEYDILLSSLDLNQLESQLYCHYKVCLNNGIIISQPKSNFLNSIIKKIIDGSKEPKGSGGKEPKGSGGKEPKGSGSIPYYDVSRMNTISWTTGPCFLTQIYKNYPNKNEIKVLDWSYLEPCSIFGICKIKNNTYTKHNHTVTWIEEPLKTMIYYYFKYKPYIYSLILIVLIIILTQVFNKFLNPIK